MELGKEYTAPWCSSGETQPQTVLMILIVWISGANARRVLLVATFIAFCYRVVTHQNRGMRTVLI